MPINVFTHTPLQQYPLTFDTKKIDPKSRIDFLVYKLNEANDAYYHTTKPIMSDQAYDKLYREVRSDDIIRYAAPSQCPYCSSPTKMEGKYMYCSNPDCKDQ